MTDVTQDQTSRITRGNGTIGSPIYDCWKYFIKESNKKLMKKFNTLYSNIFRYFFGNFSFHIGY